MAIVFPREWLSRESFAKELLGFFLAIFAVLFTILVLMSRKRSPSTATPAATPAAAKKKVAKVDDFPNGPPTFSTLPDELVMHALSYLVSDTEITTLARALCTSVGLSKMALSTIHRDDAVWRTFCNRRFRLEALYEPTGLPCDSYWDAACAWTALRAARGAVTLFHGTSWDSAMAIQAAGRLIPSGAGNLGQGIYVAPEDKARRFALANGGAGALVEVRINVANPKYVRTDDETWQAQGYDACCAHNTSVSANLEWCVLDPTQVQVIGVTRVVPLRGCGP